MAIEITIPRLGWSMDEGTFGRWLKQDGERVEEGDALFELEGDKAVQPVEAFDAGILRIIPNGPTAGDTVHVGDRLAYLCQPGEAAPFETSPDSAAATTTRSVGASSRPTSAGPPPVTPKTVPTREASNGAGRRPPVTPSARRLARELGVDLEQVNTTGPRLTAADVRAVASGDATRVSSPTDGQSMRVSPRAARAAAKLGVNLADVTATGSSGRIRERDVLTAASQRKMNPVSCAAPSGARHDARTPVTSLRQTIAARMLAAAQQTAAVTLTASVDASSLVLLRNQNKMSSGTNAPALSYTDMLVKLAAVALERHPALMQQWTEQGLVIPSSLDIAVAVDTPQGLLTPVLRDVAALSLSEISLRLADLITRARARRLSSDEMRGGVFTITNLGGYRVEAFTPLLNLPQTSILGVGRIAPQPMAVERRIEVRDRVTLSLTFDHRVVDGATAAALLTTLCELVENPLSVLVA